MGAGDVLLSVWGCGRPSHAMCPVPVRTVRESHAHTHTHI